MKSIALSLVLVAGGLLSFSGQVSAAPPRVGVGVGVGVGFASGGLTFSVGTASFNQRFVPVGQVWVNEPYIYWQTIPDPFTGRLVRVQRIGYTRRLTVLYWDRLQGGYGYFDRFGNPIPWNGYRHW